MSTSDALVPERFVPAAMRGQLVEAEHLVRYWWAARLASGRRVLDAGCGTAYGSAMLAEAGAEHVTGIDRAASVLETARPSLPPNVDLVVGDLRELPFPDRSFDLVVCFEVVEHLEEPDAALRELSRVVSGDGIVLVSSPNRDVYEPGNPHHLHEYVPAELRQALQRYFAHVELRCQANLIASSVMPGDVAGGAELEAVHDLRLAKCAALPAEGETYTLALASHVSLPPDRSTTAVATGLTEIRRWVELYEAQQQALADLTRKLRRLESEADELQERREVLVEREAEIARLQERLERSAAVMEAMKRSPSWRVTAPLRALKRLRR